MGERKFPDKFLWGAATSAHQVEGNNVHSDWWAWEQEYAGKPGGPEEKSGIACDSYNRYEEDFTLAHKLGHSIHRLSIEWARIEPEEGKYVMEEIEHYRKVLKSAKAHGMKTFVTLWHFTLPIWVRSRGGMGYPTTPAKFAKFAELVAKELGEDIDYFATLNEPVVYVFLRHIVKTWIPQKDSNLLFFLGSWFGLLGAHRRAYKAIKAVNPNYQVGVVENLMWIEPAKDSVVARFTGFVRELMQYRIFLFFAMKFSDFIGVNYYFHDIVHARDIFFRKKFPDNMDGHDVERSDWGWEICPEGIYQVVKIASSYGKPVYITENGLADARDEKRESFIVKHLYWLHKAIEEGCDLRGYMHWALLDNFEWAEGYKRRFGLIEIDRENNLQRNVRPSAITYAEICKNNLISEELLQKYQLNQ